MYTLPQILKVRTSDGIDFDVSLGVVKQMGLIRSCLEKEDIDNNWKDFDHNDDDNIIYLDRVTSDIFKLVLQWCNQLVEVSVDVWNTQTTLFSTILKQQNDNNSTMFELIMAADYLNIESLLEVGTTYVAKLMTECNSIDDISKRFKIVTDVEFEEDF